MLKKILQRFTIFDLIVLALMACLGIATKPIIVPLTQIITGPLFIPRGVIAGGFYMMWLVMGAGLVQKTGAGTLTAAVQAIMITALGIFGTHGIMSLVTYLLPGIAVDLVMLFWRYKSKVTSCFAAGIAANICGTALVNLVFFRLPWIPLVFSLASAALSGGLGGLIAYVVLQGMEKSGLKSLMSRRG